MDSEKNIPENGDHSINQPPEIGNDAFHDGKEGGNSEEIAKNTPDKEEKKPEEEQGTIPEKGEEKQNPLDEIIAKDNATTPDPDPDPDPEPEPEPEPKKKKKKKKKNKSEDLFLVAVDFLDEIKTQSCVAIGGGAATRYEGNKKHKKGLKRAIKKHFKEKGASVDFSPMQYILFYTFLLIGPAAFNVFLDRKKQQKEPVVDTNKANHQTDEAPPQEAAPQEVDLSQIHEAKIGRKRFATHSTGCYLYDDNGVYQKVAVAKTKPTKEIQKLLDQGVKPKEIKAMIYGE